MEYIGRVLVGWPDGRWSDLGRCRADVCNEDAPVAVDGEPYDPLHEAAMNMVYAYVEDLVESGQAPERADFTLLYHFWPFYQMN